jgi:DNA-binding GntR family transcriptional regulator
VKSPILIVRRTFYGVGGVPLELSITSYTGDLYQYEITIV